MTDDLIPKLEAAYKKVAMFPEDSPTGWGDLIELRHLVPDALVQLAVQGQELARLQASVAELTPPPPPSEGAVPHADKIACLQREVKMRHRAYPRWVGQGRMTQAQADHEIAVMTAVLSDYEAQVVPAPDLFGGLA